MPVAYSTRQETTTNLVIQTITYSKKREKIPLARTNWSCSHCGATSTPLRRKGPEGKSTLCNACGLQYSSILRRDKNKKPQKGQLAYIMNS